MADDAPDKINFGIGQGFTRNMVRLADGSYADRTAPAAGAGLVTDSTGQVMFDISSLPSKTKYDSNDNPVSITFGPDQRGRFVRQTTTWVQRSGGWYVDTESAWVMVSGVDAP